MLRDDQVKPCFQQRRLAVTQSEWDVEPASEKCFFFWAVVGEGWVIIQDLRPDTGFRKQVYAQKARTSDIFAPKYLNDN